MSPKRITRRIAAATLAAALTVGGLVAVGTAIDTGTADTAEEQAGATWSYTVGPVAKKGADTLGATWS